MQTSSCGRSSLIFSKVLTITALTLGISLGSLNLAAQSVPPEEQSEPPEAQSAPPEERSEPPEAQSAPSELTLQPGTVITVRTNDWLSSDQNREGDDFSAVLEQPLVADGWVVAYAGQTVTGRVAVAQRAGRAKGVSRLGLELDELTLADGQVVPLMTRLLERSAGASRGRDVAAVAGTTVAGATIGAIAGGGKGAGIGAGVGAAAGIIGVLATPGRATEIPPETLLTFRVEAPVSFSTERSRTAFQPVTPETYRTAEPARNYRRQQYVAPPNRGYYPPPVVYRRYPEPYYYPVDVYPYDDDYYYRPYRYYPYYSGSSFVFRFDTSHRHGHYDRHRRH